MSSLRLHLQLSRILWTSSCCSSLPTTINEANSSSSSSSFDIFIYLLHLIKRTNAYKELAIFALKWRLTDDFVRVPENENGRIREPTFVPHTKYEWFCLLYPSVLMISTTSIGTCNLAQIWSDFYIKYEP